MYYALRDRFCELLDRWMFPPRAAESGEVFLHQRRVYILPSRAGLGLGVMLIALLVGSINYNLSLGFALTFLIGGCGLIDMYLAFRNLAHLHLKHGRVQPVFAGDEAQFELLFSNRQRRDRYAIWIAFFGEGLPDIEKPVDVPRNTTRSITLGVAAPQRGWLPAPRLRMQTYFPLGLFRAWAYWLPDTGTLVYPRPEAIPAPLPFAAQEGGDGSGMAGQDDFSGVRAYQPGDSMRQLAWRQIARTDLDAGGTLVTKHFEGGAAGEVFIDFTQLPATLELESRLSRMTRWVLEAEAQGLPYAFRLGGTALTAALGPAHRDACLRALALYGHAS